jgi:hypothetical protein
MSRLEDNYSLVRKMKQLVPEFISNNSQYEELDQIHMDKTLFEAAGGS